MHSVSTLLRQTLQVVSKWSASGHQVVTKLSSSCHQVISKWSAGGYQVVTKWLPSSYHLGTLLDRLGDPTRPHQTIRYLPEQHKVRDRGTGGPR